jgi:hypothetical protein
VTNTGTQPPTTTFTITPTAVTVQASAGNNPPGNSSQLQGASGVPVDQVVLANPGALPVTMTSLTVTEPGAPASGIQSVTLLKNGVPISSTSFTGATAVFNFDDTIPPNGGAVTYTVQANFAAGSPAGNYQFSVTGETGNNGQAALFAPAAVPGATITILIPTATYTPTVTRTPTVTFTPTITFTPTATVPVVDTIFIGQNVFHPAQGPLTIQVQYSKYPGPYSIKIYNTVGEFIRNLSKDTNPPSPDYLKAPLPLTTYLWHGTNYADNPCASGVYILYVTEPEGVKVKKFVLIH